VIIGVVLIVSIYITSSIEDVTKVKNTEVTALNESVTFGILNAAQTLDVATLEGVSCSAVTALTNYTATGLELTVANVTLTSDCTLLNATALDTYPLEGGEGVVYVSYTYTYTATSDASNAASDVVTALATGTSWISILVVVGFAVIILTMLTSGLGNTIGRRENDVPYY